MKIINWIKRQKEKVAAVLAGASVIVATTVTTFAATSDYVALQSSDLEPIIQAAKDNIAVIIPVAIGLFAIVLGISFAPMILKKFKKG